MAKVKVLRGFRAPDVVEKVTVEVVDDNGDVVLDAKKKPVTEEVDKVTEFDVIRPGIYEVKDLPQEVVAFGLEELYVVKVKA